MRGISLADVPADLRTNPDPRWLRRVEGPHWRGPDGVVYLPWTDRLSPAAAVAELRRGARVAYDQCGCGGYCDVKWLTPDELDELRSAPLPDLHPAKHGIARLEGWRSPAGEVLIAAVGDVSWGGVVGG